MIGVCGCCHRTSGGWVMAAFVVGLVLSVQGALCLPLRVLSGGVMPSSLGERGRVPLYR